MYAEQFLLVCVFHFSLIRLSSVALWDHISNLLAKLSEKQDLQKV